MASSTGEASNDKEVGSDLRKKREDFEFGKILGEGSYSTVLLATDKVSKKLYAMKILSKHHIVKEKKVPYVKREKDVLVKINHPFFVKLFFTFQDKENLYYGLSLAEKGEILDYIRRVGSFDEHGSQFYSAEIILALEYLHSLDIIHRDLKPENILLNNEMHIQITDFGTAKILEDGEERANSFVGTAEYVSPELLQSKVAYKSSDIWALGCILYQLLSGRPPFHAPNEYLCFQKITKLEYMFPDGFPDHAKDLISKILILAPDKRIGCEQMGGYQPLKTHKFYTGIDWAKLPETQPPQILPYLPAKSKDDQALTSDYNIMNDRPLSDDFDERFLSAFGLGDPDNPLKSSSSASITSNRETKLERQAKESPWHQFVNNELIVKSGLVDKRKGLFSKRRQLILTDAPRLYYVDPVAMELKGEIPWNHRMHVELKNWRIFFVHTPDRTYYLDDPTGHSQQWVNTITEWIERARSS
ncbi:3-phosphoinositide-dependent protein kinase 1-like [Dysidea avara]|uniref:3-phosphoinositide-dependent protein kinase 1-like n=1 Tax=Dysidea avara TaxID=196820 RepID=UPI00332A712D